MNTKLLFISISLLTLINKINNHNFQIAQENKEIYQISNIAYEFFDILIYTEECKINILKKIKPGTIMKTQNYDKTNIKKHKVKSIIEFNDSIFIQFEKDHNLNNYIPYIFSLNELSITATMLDMNIKIINF